MAPEGRVLVVDDDEDFRSILAESLRLEGYDVALARDGAEGLTALARGPRPCAILLDWLMPKVNGADFLEKVRQDPRNTGVAVIIVTGAFQTAGAAPAPTGTSSSRSSSPSSRTRSSAPVAGGWSRERTPADPRTRAGARRRREPGGAMVSCRALQTPAQFLARWHYAGLFALIFAEEAGIPLPVPGDLFIAAMGALAGSGRASFGATALVVTVATVLGATVLYNVSRHAGRPLILALARRFGYTDERHARVERWLARRGATAVVVGRLVPGLRIVMTIAAGALRLSRATFALGTLLAGAIWATLYFWIGYAAGAGWQRYGSVVRLDGTSVALVAAAAVATAYLVWRRIKVRGRPQEAIPSSLGEDER